ncbi:methyltransferase domain-containing protein [Limibacter armeniacum]|uniref:class I SAM-dependent methyltransferase n=1 Tax=Limibacter armeniacum TaxID=466084 RepID=UPI002FE5D013
MNKEQMYQLEVESARFYEQNFVPAVFSSWAQKVINYLDLRPSEDFLDVACGTGIVARTAKCRQNKRVHITGCDINKGMLQVAQEMEPNIEWVVGDAEKLPFESRTFDKIACQFALMFFSNKVKAINEMVRLKRNGGKVVISTWDILEANEGYYDFHRLLEEVGGKALGDILMAPFSLGKISNINLIMSESRVSSYRIENVREEVVFPSIKYWIDCDIHGSPIAEKITEPQYHQLLGLAEEQLEKYISEEGDVRFNMSAHMIIIE